MAQPLSFTLHVPESRDGASPYLSLDDEGTVHRSFHQLIQEQSCAAEQELQELELQERSPGGRETLAPTAAPACPAEAWEGPEQRGEHLDFSSATLRILASMPSRTIGRSRGAVLSQCYMRTERLRRRSSRPPLHPMARCARPSLRQRSLALDAGHAEEGEERSLLVKELQSLASSQRNHTLRAMPVSLAEKRSLRQESGGHRSTLRRPGGSPLSCCGQLKSYVILGLRSLWYGFLSLLHSFQPWHYPLKQIGGRFGSSVLSYFLFLKTLLMFNGFLFLVLLLFVVAVQAAYPPATRNSRPFTGLEPLTGAGYFTQTVMYYGHYSNFTLNDPCSSGASSKPCPPGKGPLPYNMPLAYVFTVGVSFFMTCILLVYSMSRSFGESYCVGSTSGDLAVKVFCAWDYKVIQRRAVRLQSANIRTQLKERLAAWQSKSHPMSLGRRLGRRLVLSLAWALALSTVLGCVLAVQYFSEHMHQAHQDSRARGSSETQQEALLLALPVVVSVLNLVTPYLYSLLAAWEKQESPVLEVYVAICRNLMLKMVVLGLLCYHWLSRRENWEDECWETAVGQELYRFVVMDFIFTLLDTFFGELVWRLVLEKKLKRKQRPEFDIARNVLQLIYGQTLTWLGVLFSPLLPAVQILKLVLLFYIKKTSLMMNCQSPSKPWQASHMSTIFITLLCFPSFLGAAVFVSYTIWSVRPSKTCGPFQTQRTIYESGKAWVRELEKSSPNLAWFTWIHQYLVENTFFLFFVAGVLLAVIYLHIQVVKGQRRIIRLLKGQIANEGEDKIFLIQKLHCIYGKRETHRESQDSLGRS